MAGLRAIVLMILALPVLLETASGQERLLHGVILDETTEQPVQGAHITIEGQEGGTVSDGGGAFSLSLAGIKATRIRVTHVSYNTRSINLADVGSNGSAAIIIRLKPKVIELRTVEIHRALPEVVYQRPDLHVGDYRVNQEGLWVLVYDRPRMWHREEHAGERIFIGARLHLLDTAFQERFVIPLPGNGIGLHKDHDGRVIFEGEEMAWVAGVGPTGIELVPMELKILREEVLPWTDSIAGRLLGNNRTESFPAFDHFARDPLTNEERLICSVRDDHTMELFRSQYKYMSGHDKVVAMDMEKETGIDREVIAGFMTGFQKERYFHVPYAPLFVVGNTLCVFDHERGKIQRFTTSLATLDDVPMTYHQQRAWCRELLQDPVDGQVYARFAQGPNTWLCKVDPATGSVGPPRVLDLPWPEDVQVHDGYAYYVYRPFGSSQRRTLYRQQLN